MFADTEVGGLSGLAFDPSTSTLFTISDNRNTPMFYQFQVKVSLDPNEVDIFPTAVKLLRMTADRPFHPQFIDPEGIALLPGGNFLVSQEGLSPILPPSLMEFNSSSVFKRHIPVPSKFIAYSNADEQTQGVLHNGAFETLTIDPDKKTVFLATEFWLMQDEPFIIKSEQAFVRILTFDYLNSPDKFTQKSEYLYNLHGMQGLVDMIAYSQTELLSLERGWDPINKIQHSQIYKVSTSGATNITSNFAVTSTEHITPTAKELLLDLQTIIPKLSQVYPKLDNYEGISFGPKLANGHDTLIIVSDNNFSEHQMTVFLVFEVIP